MRNVRKIYKRILVTQTGGWIGDMILLTPTLRALRHTYKYSHIALLLRPLVWELMRNNPYIDELIVYNKRREHKGIRVLWNLAGQLREAKFDIAIVLHPNSVRSAVIPYLGGIPERIGTRVNGRGIFLTRTINDRDDIHEIQRYLRVLKLIGIDDTDPRLELWHTDEERCFVEQLLTEHGALDKTLVGINPGTTWPTKRWRLERFAQVIDALSQKKDVRVIVTGSPAEQYLGEKLKSLTSTKFINMIGKTTILQLGALIERCSYYLTCDSGPMHIAAAVNTPTIALFGPTSFIRHPPYGHGHIVIQKPAECRPCYERTCTKNYACMEAIEVEDVLIDAL